MCEILIFLLSRAQLESGRELPLAMKSTMILDRLEDIKKRKVFLE